MKKLFALAALAALAVPAAFAGDSGSYSCDNHCPLAKQANTLRADGAEAAQASAVVRAELAAAVERNIGRI